MAAFNAELYLDRAINSIVSSSYRNWELLCVDDGSTDSTLSLATAWAKIDQRVIVLKQDNAGPARARQRAYLSSTGDLVMHLDSDDWLDPDALSVLANDAVDSDADIVMADMKRFDVRSNQWKSFSSDRGMIYGQVLNGLDAFDLTFPWVVNGCLLVKRRVLSEALSSMGFSNRYNSDEYFTRLLLSKSKNLTFSRGTYFYFFNPASLTSKPGPRALCILETNNQIINLALALNRSPLVLCRVLEGCCEGVLQYSRTLGRLLRDGSLPISAAPAYIKLLVEAAELYCSAANGLSVPPERRVRRAKRAVLYPYAACVFIKAVLTQGSVVSSLRKLVEL